MNLIKLFSLVTLLLFSTSCKKEVKTPAENTLKTAVESSEKQATPVTKKIKVNLEAKNDSNLTGSVVFVERENKVTVTALISGLEKGMHAIHIHEKPACSSPDGKSAGGHWNPTFKAHGKWGANEGYHKGDIGNFETDTNGNGTISLSTTEWCIGCGDPKKDIVGKAIIVHNGQDDFTSQPSGAAGKRFGCGVISL